MKIICSSVELKLAPDNLYFLFNCFVMGLLSDFKAKLFRTLSMLFGVD